MKMFVLIPLKDRDEGNCVIDIDSIRTVFDSADGGCTVTFFVEEDTCMIKSPLSAAKLYKEILHTTNYYLTGKRY